jgi:hypothetical protein
MLWESQETSDWNANNEEINTITELTMLKCDGFLALQDNCNYLIYLECFIIS